jgi:hypothetical protein
MGMQDYNQDGTEMELNDLELNDLEKKLENAYTLHNNHNIKDDKINNSLIILVSLHYQYKNTHFKEKFLIKNLLLINSLYENIEETVDFIDKVNKTSPNDELLSRHYGGKRKSKSKKNNVSKKPVVSQNKQSEYKEILGKKMKIYKMPDSRKQYVRYKGELHSISDYKNLMKQKAAAKAKK